MQPPLRDGHSTPISGTGTARMSVGSPDLAVVPYIQDAAGASWDQQPPSRVSSSRISHPGQGSSYLEQRSKRTGGVDSDCSFIVRAQASSLPAETLATRSEAEP